MKRRMQFQTTSNEVINKILTRESNLTQSENQNRNENSSTHSTNISHESDEEDFQIKTVKNKIDELFTTYSIFNIFDSVFKDEIKVPKIFHTFCFNCELPFSKIFSSARVYCKVCNNVFCDNCCNKVIDASYWGLKNKKFTVCDFCFNSYVKFDYVRNFCTNSSNNKARTTNIEFYLKNYYREAQDCISFQRLFVNYKDDSKIYLREKINKVYEIILDNIVYCILEELELDSKWLEPITSNIKEAINLVQPCNKDLNDSMDINNYIITKTINISDLDTNSFNNSSNDFSVNNDHYNSNLHYTNNYSNKYKKENKGIEIKESIKMWNTPKLCTTCKKESTDFAINDMFHNINYDARYNKVSQYKDKDSNNSSVLEYSQSNTSFDKSRTKSNKKKKSYYDKEIDTIIENNENDNSSNKNIFINTNQHSCDRALNYKTYYTNDKTSDFYKLKYNKLQDTSGNNTNNLTKKMIYESDDQTNDKINTSNSNNPSSPSPNNNRSYIGNTNNSNTNNLNNNDLIKRINGYCLVKKLFLKNFPQYIKNPKIIVFNCSLEYSRCSHLTLLSLKDYIQAENYYYEILCKKIFYLKPDIIISEGKIAMKLKEKLYKYRKEILLITNVDSLHLQNIARMTKTYVLNSSEFLDNDMILGKCESLSIFPMKSLLKNNFLIIFQGCNSLLGNTLLVFSHCETEMQLLEKAIRIILLSARNLYLRKFMIDYFNCKVQFPELGEELDRSTSQLIFDNNNNAYFSNTNNKDLEISRDYSVQYNSILERSNHKSSTIYTKLPIPSSNNFLKSNVNMNNNISNAFTSRISKANNFMTIKHDDRPSINITNNINTEYINLSNNLVANKQSSFITSVACFTKPSSLKAKHNIKKYEAENLSQALTFFEKFKKDELFNKGNFFFGFDTTILTNENKTLTVTKVVITLGQPISQQNHIMNFFLETAGKEPSKSTLENNDNEINSDEFNEKIVLPKQLLSENQVLSVIKNICDEPASLKFEYYADELTNNMSKDKPLGKFILELINSKNTKCCKCKKIQEDHIYYIYKKIGRIKISFMDKENLKLNDVETKLYNIHMSIKQLVLKNNLNYNKSDIFSYGICRHVCRNECFYSTTTNSNNNFSNYNDIGNNRDTLNTRFNNNSNINTTNNFKFHNNNTNNTNNNTSPYISPNRKKSDDHLHIPTFSSHPAKHIKNPNCAQCYNKLVTSIIKLPRELFNMSVAQYFKFYLYDNEVYNQSIKFKTPNNICNPLFELSSECNHLVNQDIDRIFFTETGAVRFQYERTNLYIIEPNLSREYNETHYFNILQYFISHCKSIVNDVIYRMIFNLQSMNKDLKEIINSYNTYSSYLKNSEKYEEISKVLLLSNNLYANIEQTETRVKDIENFFCYCIDFHAKESRFEDYIKFLLFKKKVYFRIVQMQIKCVWLTKMFNLFEEMLKLFEVCITNNVSGYIYENKNNTNTANNTNNTNNINITNTTNIKSSINNNIIVNEALSYKNLSVTMNNSENLSNCTTNITNPNGKLFSNDEIGEKVKSSFKHSNNKSLVIQKRSFANTTQITNDIDDLDKEAERSKINISKKHSITLMNNLNSNNNNNNILINKPVVNKQSTLNLTNSINDTIIINNSNTSNTCNNTNANLNNTSSAIERNIINTSNEEAKQEPKQDIKQEIKQLYSYFNLSNSISYSEMLSSICCLDEMHKMTTTDVSEDDLSSIIAYVLTSDKYRDFICQSNKFKLIDLKCERANDWNSILKQQINNIQDKYHENHFDANTISHNHPNNNENNSSKNTNNNNTNKNTDNYIIPGSFDWYIPSLSFDSSKNRYSTASGECSNKIINNQLETELLTDDSSHFIMTISSNSLLSRLKAWSADLEMPPLIRKQDKTSSLNSKQNLIYSKNTKINETLKNTSTSEYKHIAKNELNDNKRKDQVKETRINKENITFSTTISSTGNVPNMNTSNNNNNNTVNPNNHNTSQDQESANNNNNSSNTINNNTASSYNINNFNSNVNKKTILPMIDIEAQFQEISMTIEKLSTVKKEILGKISQHNITHNANTQSNIKLNKLETKNIDIGSDYVCPQLELEVICYFPRQFEALRIAYCSSYEKFVLSVAYSFEWDNVTGGKSNSKFYKTHDNRFILKSISKKEFKMFIESGSQYFHHNAKYLFHKMPSSLAKILGAYRIHKKKGSNDSHNEKYYIFLMENMFYNKDTGVNLNTNSQSNNNPNSNVNLNVNSNFNSSSNIPNSFTINNNNPNQNINSNKIIKKTSKIDNNSASINCNPSKMISSKNIASSLNVLANTNIHYNNLDSSNLIELKENNPNYSNNKQLFNNNTNNKKRPKLRTYDLKGSRINRYISPKDQKIDQVLLDTNFKEDFSGEPIALENDFAKLLHAAIHNDTLLLSKLNVVDYSLLLIIDDVSQDIEDKIDKFPIKTIKVGIIDYVRKYTWDKQLENLGKTIINRMQAPTIVHPYNYRERFIESMNGYFIGI